ncbi:MAG TPA: L-threonylcarbamoyladenylate synthase [Actinomycetes bacterium]|nr:L-threonylcarbamoyladenylate synthase [Actinomycetes bacterium]
MPRFSCSDPDERARGIARAVTAAGRHQLVVIPTETSYAVACDAFSPVAIERLNEAKGRSALEALPVMVGSVKAAKAVVGSLHPQGEALIEGFWPGPLTAVCPQQSTLTWDIGGDGSYVAVRMPLHPVALEVLQGVGPMAVIAANRVGEPVPRTCDDAQAQFGSAVTVYLDAGTRPEGVASTVVDLTDREPRVLRSGAISDEELRTVAPDLHPVDEPDASADG